MATQLVSVDWPEQYANLLANSGLALIAWFSLAIHKPFTIQYAREQVAKEFWQSPIFIRINEIITLVWACSFLMIVLLNISQLSWIKLANGLYQVLTYAPMIVAIWFTRVFPEWYKQRRTQHIIDQSQVKQKNNPFLQGNFAPIHDELDLENLEVIGEIPADLTGVYMRNGPNPAFPPFSYTYPFDGDGILHAIYLHNGKASYKNRFIKTAQLAVEQRLGKAIYGGVACPFIRDEKLLKPTDPTMPVKLGRFIHIIRHNELYLALHESTSAYQVDAQLNTIGEWNPTQEATAIDVNAHTRLDPDTGELYFISYHMDKSIISYHVLDKQAKLIQSGFFDVPYAYMVHDFVLTTNYIVIFLCPAVVDFADFIAGKALINWRPELNTRVAVLARNNPSTNIQWFETEAFFSYHFANAYEEQNKIKVTHARYSNFTTDTKNLVAAHLYQTTLDIATRQCHHQQLDDTKIEFPRINENYNSKAYRYIYMPCNLHKNNGDDIYHALAKYDVTTQRFSTYDFGSDYEIGEAVFAAKPHAQAEDDGYLMLFAYNKAEDKSEFIILDAKNFPAKPLASIKLPQRVPHGLHGSWLMGS